MRHCEKALLPRIGQCHLHYRVPGAQSEGDWLSLGEKPAGAFGQVETVKGFLHYCTSLNGKNERNGGAYTHLYHLYSHRHKSALVQAAHHRGAKVRDIDLQYLIQVFVRPCKGRGAVVDDAGEESLVSVRGCDAACIHITCNVTCNRPKSPPL